jgi:hypothetical protein
MAANSAVCKKVKRDLLSPKSQPRDRVRAAFEIITKIGWYYLHERA